MAQVAINATTYTNEGDTNALTVSSVTVSPGEMLVVCATLETTDAGKEIDNIQFEASGGDEAFTLHDSFNPSSGKLRVEIWRLNNPSDQTQNVVATIAGGNSQKFGLTVLRATNMDTITPLSDPAQEEGGSGSSGAVSFSQDADDLGLIVAGHNNTNAIGPADTETEHSDVTVQGSFKHAVYTQDGAGTISVGWSSTDSTERATLGAVIETVVVGGLEMRNTVMWGVGRGIGRGMR